MQPRFRRSAVSERHREKSASEASAPRAALRVFALFALLLGLTAATTADASAFIKAYDAGVTDGASQFETCTSTCQAGISGGGAGEFESPHGVATDSSGDVYVSGGNNRIDEFSGAGAVIKAYSWGVSDGASQFETCASTCLPGISGGGAGEFDDPDSVATDSSGDFYVADTHYYRIHEFSGSAASTLTQGPPTQATVTPGSGVLVGVSCTTVHACMAVGTRLTSGPAESSYTLAEKWNGKTWTVIPTPNPKSSLGNDLYGVACSSANVCMAVGMHQIPHGGVPLAEEWNGKTWTVKRTPTPDNNSSLVSVSCSSANACVATGFAINNHNNWFAEAWNGRTWTLKTAPRPAATTYSGLGSVSCASARVCIAVGKYQVNDSSKSRTLAETWDGKTWTINATPNPSSGANGTELNGVSCSSSQACVAVGSSGLVETWNGKAWAIMASRNTRKDAGDTLQALSCRSAHGCVAVGSALSNSVAEGSKGLAEAWNGRVWTFEPFPNPAGATEVLLADVSCSSVLDCVAVGSYQTSTFSPEFPLAEVWNGKTWTTTATPL
jgi:hypothetical protein